MKKLHTRALAVLAALTVSGAALSLNAFAEETQSSVKTGTYVYCETDDLTDSQVSMLDKKATEISEEYGCGVYCVIVDDMRNYNYYNIEEFAQDFFTGYKLGLGSDNSGVMLMLSMGDRDYITLAHGDIANTAFTDYGKEVMESAFLDNFKVNDFYTGYSDYLEECSYMLGEAAKGTPVDVPPAEPTPIPVIIIGALILALVIALVTAKAYVAGLKARMRTAVAAKKADTYLAAANITEKSDIFLRKDVVRTPINRERSSGGGHHGGTTVNSGGFSSRSGKF